MGATYDLAVGFISNSLVKVIVYMVNALLYEALLWWNIYAKEGLNK